MPDAFDRQIVQRLSMSRLTGYLRVSSNDISLALRLYEWNTQMSAAFFELLSDVEVVVRNSFHEQLTVWHAAIRHQFRRSKISLRQQSLFGESTEWAKEPDALWC